MVAAEGIFGAWLPAFASTVRDPRSDSNQSTGRYSPTIYTKSRSQNLDSTKKTMATTGSQARKLTRTSAGPDRSRQLGDCGPPARARTPARRRALNCSRRTSVRRSNSAGTAQCALAYAAGTGLTCSSGSKYTTPDTGEDVILGRKPWQPLRQMASPERYERRNRARGLECPCAVGPMAKRPFLPGGVPRSVIAPTGPRASLRSNWDSSCGRCPTWLGLPMILRSRSL